MPTAIRLFNEGGARFCNITCERSSSSVSARRSSVSDPAVGRRLHPRRQRRSTRAPTGVEDEARMRDLALPVDRPRPLLVVVQAPTPNGNQIDRRGAPEPGHPLLEQGGRLERVLARRPLRGELGVLHGRRLQRTPWVTSTPSNLPTSPMPIIRRRKSSKRSSTSPTASTTTPPSSSAKIQEKYQPLYNDSEQRSSRRFHGDDQEEAFYKFLKPGARRHDPAANLLAADQDGRRERALSDRQLLRYLQYVQVLDDENKRFGSLQSPEFKTSALGNDSKDALVSSPVTIAMRRRPAQLARERYQRNLDELNEHLRDSAKILIDITAAQRNQLDQVDRRRSGDAAGVAAKHREAGRRARSCGRSTASTGATSSGSYRQTITSKCGR